MTTALFISEHGANLFARKYQAMHKYVVATEVKPWFKRGHMLGWYIGYREDNGAHACVEEREVA